MFEAIRYNLTESGAISRAGIRRSTFWFYVLFLVIIQVVISMAPIDRVRRDHGGRCNPVGPRQQQRCGHAKAHDDANGGHDAHFDVGLGGHVDCHDASAGASFTRRLHDAGKPGWITGLVAVIQILALIATISMIGDMVAYFSTMKLGDQTTIQAAAQANQAKYAGRSAIGYIPMLLLIVFGVWPSSDGENRYGPEPDHMLIPLLPGARIGPMILVHDQITDASCAWADFRFGKRARNPGSRQDA